MSERENFYYCRYRFFSKINIDHVAYHSGSVLGPVLNMNPTIFFENRYRSTENQYIDRRVVKSRNKIGIGIEIGIGIQNSSGSGSRSGFKTVRDRDRDRDRDWPIPNFFWSSGSGSGWTKWEFLGKNRLFQYKKCLCHMYMLDYKNGTSVWAVFLKNLASNRKKKENVGPNPE